MYGAYAQKASMLELKLWQKEQERFNGVFANNTKVK